MPIINTSAVWILGVGTEMAPSQMGLGLLEIFQSTDMSLKVLHLDPFGWTN